MQNNDASLFAVVFPGQGSQFVGMMRSFGAYPIVKSTFAQARDTLHYDLWQLVETGPEEKLNQTEYTQPALLTASLAIWRVFLGNASRLPDFLAGHSLGEYTALVCAGSIDFEDALKLVEKRGQLMRQAVPDGIGAMAVILGLDETKLQEICIQASKEGMELVEPANYNSPTQVVIAGVRPAVERAMALAKQKGAKRVFLLPMSVPSHCALMHQAGQLLKDYLNTLIIQKPTIPILNNVDVGFYQENGDIKDGLVRQLYLPVRWKEVISTLFLKQGVKRFLECGSRNILTGLGKQIAPLATHISLGNPNAYKQ